MARTSSQSQSSVGGGAGASRPATVGPRGTAAATAGMRRRPGRTSSSSGAGGGGGFSGGGNNMLRFYTDEAPGLRLSPTMVLVMSVCFIGFVTALHVFGKLYRSRTAASSASA
jgi:protein transport protein SEC61 subunit beta